MTAWRRGATVLALWIAACSAAVAEGGARIAIVTWRGCEEACQGFQDHLNATGRPIEFTVLDAGQDKTSLPGILARARADAADLIVTWGTTVTIGIGGTLETQGAPDLNSDIPQVFMIVADPVGSGVVRSLDETGRANITGTYNRMPETVTLQTIRSFLPTVSRIGLLFNADEKNSTVKRDEVAALAAAQGLELTALEIALDADGKPMAADIAPKMAALKEAGVEFVYLGSSSFLQAHAVELGRAAEAAKMPVISPYEDMVRDGAALISVAARYYDVGRLAGQQAEKILFEGVAPGDLPVLRMSEFAVTINMSVASAIGAYPPIGLMQMAEIID
ncbi:ABC transporter substrate-binding protein [Albimonas sp. CAU 1670]|uniref:ABC transporter substrate-binding protein n=1 Tax=Albimonas sp. CAU 1670 TaxID=3032599 RepID=UPI0023DBBBA6|nr:ABC transporter substrate-binding protein [Albimonas sp. CAU 1670]MDF2235730.1 ABC transporter substrate-binding protein [Albimonas sp. CAU 1670]